LTKIAYYAIGLTLIGIMKGFWVGHPEFAFLQNNTKEQRGNSEKTAGVSLLSRASNRRKPRISATNEAALAVNFLEEQRKQRESE
jgi:hypothetical protein